MSLPLSYPFAAPPDPGCSQEVAPHLLWIRMPLPFALDHINLWALQGKAGWTLVDTGLGGSLTQSHWEQLLSTSLVEQGVEQIVVTHFHPDHLGSARWLQERTEAPIWMNPLEMQVAQALWDEQPLFSPKDVAQHFRRHGLPEAMAQALENSGNRYRRGIAGLPKDFQPLLPQQTLKMGDDSWETIAGYGHSPEHLSLYCAERKILIAGDMVLPRISTNIGVWPNAPEANPLAAFLESLTRLALLPEDTLVLPSHGLPFYGLHQRVEALKAHHQERLETILSVTSQPVTAADLLPVLFQRALDQHQLFFAMGEAIAHLHYLVVEQRATQAIDNHGIIRFRLAKS